MQNKPVIVIVGPTGSGKTGMGIRIAKKLSGEIISADSRAIYKGMNIGTAKPSLEEQDGVPHFGLDLVEPGERFTVADWKEYAEQEICSIRNRGNRPIIVGGTGLYVDALVYDYQFTLDAKKNYSDRNEMSSDYLVYGIKWENEELKARLRKRIELMFGEDLYQETRELVEKFGWDSQAMKSNIYQYVWKYLNNECSLEEAMELATNDDYHLAKRQMTWFKRNKNIVWLPLAEIENKILADEQ